MYKSFLFLNFILAKLTTKNKDKMYFIFKKIIEQKFLIVKKC